MGNRSSHSYNEKDDESKKIENVFNVKKAAIPLEVSLAHFTPSSFPLIPFISDKKNELCAASWKTIVSKDVTGPAGNLISGITVFYDEFYARLALFDANGSFEKILVKHSTGQNKIAAKGAILIRIVKYVLLIVEDNKKVRQSLDALGKSHAGRGIRPWQYSIFVEVLLSTLSSRLGTAATNIVMEAWVNLFAFMLKIMLPFAIRGQILQKEYNINTTADKPVNTVE